MVVNTSSDSYSPFQSPIIPEDSAQSSEDGSGMHSPVFAPGNYPGHAADNFRYSQDHLDVQHSSGIIRTQYDYGHTLSAQQPPMLDTSLELPNSSARIQFAPHYSIQRRSHLDFHPHSPVSSRMTARVPPMEFRYSPPNERHLPGGPTLDQSYSHPTDRSSVMSADDHRPSITMRTESTLSTFTVSASSRPARKEISNVVIACCQCRARKIRCDSTRPICNNCVRRSNECEYDERPRRRGPDKRPGTRQRSCKKRPSDGSAPPPKRKKVTVERLSAEGEEHPQAYASEPSPESRTMDRYSPKFYQSNLPPDMHSHPSTSAGDLEPNSHSKQEFPPYRWPLPYLYDQHHKKCGFLARDCDVRR